MFFFVSIQGEKKKKRGGWVQGGRGGSTIEAWGGGRKKEQNSLPALIVSSRQSDNQGEKPSRKIMGGRNEQGGVGSDIPRGTERRRGGVGVGGSFSSS